MLKPSELRAAIAQANEHLRRNPDRITVFINTGRIVSRGGASLSFEYRYTLNIVVLDYPGHANAILLPMLAWLRTNQPDLFESKERAEQGIRFEAEILNETTMDLSIEVDLTERVIVRPDPQANNRLWAEHVGEPEHPEYPVNDYQVEIIDRKTDALLATITYPSWRPIV